MDEALAVSFGIYWTLLYPMPSRVLTLCYAIDSHRMTLPWLCEMHGKKGTKEK